MYRATAKTILQAKKYFDQNPDGRIETGIWNIGTWNREMFYQWFRRSLNLKTGGGELTEKEAIRIRDGRIINNFMQGKKRSGGNILLDPKMKRRYPHINNTHLQLSNTNN